MEIIATSPQKQFQLEYSDTDVSVYKLQTNNKTELK